jgi:hypothetical protein
MTKHKLKKIISIFTFVLVCADSQVTAASLTLTPETETPAAKLAPFTPDDVINHAKKRPQDYDLVYLESPAGKLSLQEAIKKLNNDDFSGFSLEKSTWTGCGPGYQQSTMAHYVIDLHKKNSK